MTSHHKPPPRKHHPPVKVHRFPLYRKLQPVVEEVQKEKEMDKEKEKEETVAPEPVWSAWEQIKGPQWDGYWRAKNDEDGGWTYQFTKDGSIIWEQKPVAPAPAEATSSAATTTAGKQSATVAHHPPAGKASKAVTVAASKATTTTAKSPTVTVKEIPSFTTKKPAPPAPPKPVKVVGGSVTLKKGKQHITIPVPDPGKPIVIRRILER